MYCNSCTHCASVCLWIKAVLNSMHSNKEVMQSGHEARCPPDSCQVAVIRQNKIPSIHICCVIEELKCYFSHYSKYCSSPFQSPQQLMILCFGNCDLQQI